MKKINKKRFRWFRVAAWGLFTFLCAAFLLELFLRLGGVVFLLDQERINRIALDRDSQYIILCLGESMTVGGGHSSYPKQLEDILNNLDPGIRFAVINKGIPSANTGMIVSRLEENLNIYQPDMVLVMMGVNDLVGPQDIAFNEADTSPQPRDTLRILRLVRQAGKDIAHLIPGLWVRLEREDSISEKNRLQEADRYRNNRANFYLVKGNIFFDADENIHKNRQQAIEMYRKALELNHDLPEAMIRMGISHRELGQFIQAEKVFRKALESGPSGYRAYIELGNNFREQEEWDRAEELYRAAIREAPTAAGAYIQLGISDRLQGKWTASGETLVKAFRLEPYNPAVYRELENTLAFEDGHMSFESLLEEAVRESPNLVSFRLLLGRLYELENKPEKAERTYREVIEMSPDTPGAYRYLGALYQKQGRKSEARTYHRKASRKIRFSDFFARNYQLLKKIVDKNGCQLVCVQYPIEPVADLIALFPDHEGVVFVDNEKVFKDAVARDGYQAYFNNTFMGYEFGHCNPRGNRLLAESIADTLLRGPLRKLIGRTVPLLQDRDGQVKIEGRNNLLADEKVVLMLDAFDQGRAPASRLVERLEDSPRKVYLERHGGAARITLDFGAGVGRIAGMVACRLPADPDHLEMVEDYFHRAEFSASQDGVSWNILGPVDHPEFPVGEGWRVWLIDNQTAWRYYQLFLPASKYFGPEDCFRSLAELAIFE